MCLATIQEWQDGPEAVCHKIFKEDDDGLWSIYYPTKDPIRRGVWMKVSGQLVLSDDGQFYRGAWHAFLDRDYATARMENRRRSYGLNIGHEVVLRVMLRGIVAHDGCQIVGREMIVEG
jgi:hypothetical protein